MNLLISLALLICAVIMRWLNFVDNDEEDSAQYNDSVNEQNDKEN